MTPAEQLVSALEVRGLAVRGNPNRGWTARCPAHDDRNPSLSVGEGGDGRALVRCHAGCTTEDVVAALGMEMRDLFPTDREGSRAARPAPRSGGKKQSRLPTEARLAEWRAALLADERLLARLFALRGWTQEAVDGLELGYDAGWTGRDGGPIVFPTREATGRLAGVQRYAPNPETRKGRKMLAAKGTPRELFPPPETLPAGASVILVEGEPDAVAVWSTGLAAVGVPGARSWKSEWAPRFAGRDVVLIPDLDAEGRELMAQAACDLLPHATSVRIVNLDATRGDGGDVGDLVRDAAQEGPAGLAQARRLIERMTAEAPVLEPPPVEHTGGLLGAVRAFVRRYVVLSDPQSIAVALWALHTHAIEAAQSTPYLSVTSAEKESGKTRLLETLELLVARPWFTGRTTAAALARKTDADRPTLLLDESDATFKGDREYAETLRGVLNTGYRRGGKTTVCVGQGADITTRDFSTFGPKAIAGIGELPDTVASRSIPIRLKRRAPGEAVERFKRKVADAQATQLRERASVWAAQHEKVLAEADPGPLTELGDRADEVWEPLRAIADLAGGEWAAWARAAAIELSRRGDGDDAASDGVLVLSAIRDAIGDRPSIATAVLLEVLNADDELPFGGRRDGKGLNARGLARLLRPYGIKSGTVRDGDKTPKGYNRTAFEDAWARYALPSPGSPPQAPQAPHATDPPHEKPREHWDVADVADVAANQGMGGDAATQTATPSHNGAPAAAVSEPFTKADTVAWIIRELDAVELTDDCSDPITHARHHEPHPNTGRTVCGLCHPPAAALIENGWRR